MRRKTTFLDVRVEGIVWTMNRHGVVLRRYPDPHLPGYDAIDFAPGKIQRAVEEIARAIGATVRTRIIGRHVDELWTFPHTHAIVEAHPHAA